MKICSVCRRCYEDDVLSCFEENHGSLIEARADGCAAVANYRLEALHRTDAVSETFRAVNTILNKTYLIKFVAPGTFDETARREFLHEAQALSAIIHPNIARTFESGTLEDGSLYVVTEFCDAQTLRECLESVGKPSETTALTIARQAAEGLEAIHAAGALHRALRPENIILTTDAENRFLVKLQNLDSGAIQQTAANKSAEQNLDSFRYFSPEQCGAQAATAQADVYALGVVLYEMLAGSVPFDAPYADAIIAKHLNESPPPVKINSFDIRMLLTHTLSDALQKTTLLRMKSANAFARQLRHIEQLATHSSTPPPAVAHPALTPKPATAFTKPAKIEKVEIKPAIEKIEIAAPIAAEIEPIKEKAVEIEAQTAEEIPLVIESPAIEELPPAALQNAAEDLPQDEIQTVVEYTAQNEIQTTAEDLPQDEFETVAQDLPAIEIEAVAEEIPEPIVIETIETVAEDLPQEEIEVVAEEIPATIIETKAEDLPQAEIETVSEDLPQIETIADDDDSYIYIDLTTTKLPPLETFVENHLPANEYQTQELKKLDETADDAEIHETDKPVLIEWQQPDDVPTTTQTLNFRKKQAADAEFAPVAVFEDQAANQSDEIDDEYLSQNRQPNREQMSAEPLFAYYDTGSSWNLPDKRKIITGAAVVGLLLIAVFGTFLNRQIQSARADDQTAVKSSTKDAAQPKSAEPVKASENTTVNNTATETNAPEMPNYQPREKEEKTVAPIVQTRSKNRQAKTAPQVKNTETEVFDKKGNAKPSADKKTDTKNQTPTPSKSDIFTRPRIVKNR